MTDRFARERLRYELRRRSLAVVRSESIAPGMQRITLGGADLEGFTAPGPADHVKLFFPDPASPGETVSRDYTPFAFRTTAEGGPELDIDFYLHGDGGPASSWASRAQEGDPLAIGGPRGSLLAPADVDEAVIVADESALPAAARWLEALDREVPVTGLFSVADPATAAYLADFDGPGRELRWFSGADREARLADALRAVRPAEGTFFFLAGEATSLIPLRRHLRRELGLPKEQADVHGYWKKGVIALDHHAPLDPDDPDA